MCVVYWKGGWNKWKLLRQVLVKETSSCCWRLKTSPVSMSFSRASFSLSVFSLCTSSWTALNSLSNLHISTEWWKWKSPNVATRLMRKHICFKSQHNNMNTYYGLYTFAKIVTNCSRFISPYAQWNYNGIVCVCRMCKDCALTSSASSPGRGCGSAGPPGGALCPAARQSAAGSSSLAAGCCAGTPRCLPAVHWSAKTNNKTTRPIIGNPKVRN